jgi:hypothetical protein
MDALRGRLVAGALVQSGTTRNVGEKNGGVPLGSGHGLVMER